MASANTNSPDNNKLLEEQRATSAKLNDLLDKASDTLLCGPDCQKVKMTDELNQKFLAAQTNLETAPHQLEQSKRNYYVYSEGRPFYDNMLKEELKVKALELGDMLTKKLNEEVKNATTMNNYYQTEMINSRAMKELYSSLVNDNKKLTTLLHDSKGEILTNDRKTYYETEATNNLTNWYSWWLIIYYILFIMLILCIAFVPHNKYNIKLVSFKSLGLLVLMGFLPYLVHWLVGFAYYLGSNMSEFIASIRPKNVYNDL